MPTLNDDTDLSTLDRGDNLPEAASPESEASKKAADKLVKDIEAETRGLKDAEEAEDEVKTEAEDETKAEDEEKGEEEDEKKTKKDSRIPLKRHKEILQKERERREALERELAQSKHGDQIAETNERITKAEETLLKLETEYAQLIADDQTKEAAAKMAEIRRTERGIIETKAVMTTQAAEARAYERVRYDLTVERLEEAYPVLNPDHDEFDEETAVEVLELRDAYIATGKWSRSEAVQKAVKVLLSANTTRQTRATEADVRVTEADVAKAKAEERRKAQLKKNAEVAGRQPPKADKVGLDSDKMGGRLTSEQIMRMNQDEFAKLNEADLARLRGDEL